MVRNLMPTINGSNIIFKGLNLCLEINFNALNKNKTITNYLIKFSLVSNGDLGL